MELGVSRHIVDPTSTVIAVVEIAAGGVGIVGLERRGIGLLMAALLMSFIAVSILAARTGKHLDCNCFGASDGTQLGPQTAIRAGLMVVPLAMWQLAGNGGWSDKYSMQGLALVLGLASAMYLLGRWILALPHVWSLVRGRFAMSRDLDKLRAERRLHVMRGEL